MLRSGFAVPQMHCAGCARSIRQALADVPGVHDVLIDVRGRRVTVEHDAAIAPAESIGAAIEQAGFAVTPAPVEEVTPWPAPTPPQDERAVARPHRGLLYPLLAVVVAVLAVAGYAGYELYPRFDLPRADGAGLLLLAAGAGVASFFSPCAFPLLVTLLARETAADKRADRAYGKALGFALALSVGAAVFLLLTGAGIAFGGGALFAGVTFTSAAGMMIRAVVGGMLILLGLVQLGVLPNPLHRVEDAARPLLRVQARTRRKNANLGFLLFGFGYLLAGFG